MRAIYKISVLLTLLVAQSVAHGASASEPNESWEIPYQRCQELIRDGDYNGALAACERAYALKAEPRILPLIGRIQTALVHPVQAYEAFSLYLLTPLDERSRKTAQAQVDYLKTLITTLLVTTQVEGAEIRVDNQVIDSSSLARGVKLAAGEHRVTLQAKGAPFSRSVFLPAGERTQLEMPGDGSIALSCAIPGIRFFIDDQELNASEASRGVPRAAGSHRVMFKAATTTWPEQQVTVSPDERLSVVCTQPPVTPAAAPSAKPGMNQRGYWVTGVGLSLGIAALATAIYNGSEYNRWQTANDDLARNQTKLAFAESTSQAQQNDELMQSIQTRRKVTIGLGVAAGVITAGGVALLFTDSATTARSGSSSWLRKVATSLSVNGAVSSGEIAWRSAW